MTKWKNVLVGLALVLPLVAIGGSQSVTVDTPAMEGFNGLVEPPACEESASALPGTSTNYDCCWYFHMGKWICFTCW